MKNKDIIRIPPATFPQPAKLGIQLLSCRTSQEQPLAIEKV